MADAPGDAAGKSVAIVGLACRFPDADDPPALLDLVLTGRRAFRRLPPCRLNLAEYYSPDPATPDATYSTRAALIEGWQFDRAAFGVSAADYVTADPAHWLALETVARTLAGAGFPGGRGLARNRVGVVLGNTLTGDVSRAAALRLRWPYVRRVLADAMIASGLSREQGMPVLRQAATRYLAPFPEVTAATMTGSIPASIAARICGYFGFRGGGHAVDGASSSSLLAVASACTALMAGELDVALAGGVDVSLDPFELVGLAKTGTLAAADVRVYDENPTGFLPGEGCGVVMLMRAADARAAELPVYAEIAGWGMSSTGQPSLTAPDHASQLLALRRAYQQAAIDPADVQLIEGHGSATAAGDLAELTALAELRRGAQRAAVLGSITANVGHAKAAAGAAGLIKTVLAMSSEVLPPATGTGRPHPLLQGEAAALRLPREPAPWPDGPRIAAVSAMDPAGVNVHLVLSSEPVQASRHDRSFRVRPRARRMSAGTAGATRTTGSAAIPAAIVQPSPATATRAVAYLLQAPDRAGLAASLGRIADIAPWLTDAELHDLACQLASEPAGQGPARAAIVASRQEQLARLAREATALLPDLTAGRLAIRPGIVVAEGMRGRVTLLLSGGGNVTAGAVRPGGDTRGQRAGAAAGRTATAAEGQLPTRAGPALDWPGLAWPALAWLDRLGVQAAAAVGRGLGEITGLAWAGCLTEAEATRLARRSSEIMNSPADDTAARAGRSAQLRALLTQFVFAAPRRRLISAATGRALTSASEIVAALCAQLDSKDRLQEALSDGAEAADLLVETGPGQSLCAAAAWCSRVPAVSLAGGTDHRTGDDASHGDGRTAARATAALFVAGALGSPAMLYAGEPARPIDIWRERIFIANPCQAQLSGDAGPVPVPAARNASEALLAAGPPPPASRSAAAPGSADTLPAARRESAPAVRSGSAPEPKSGPRSASALRPAVAPKPGTGPQQAPALRPGPAPQTETGPRPASAPQPGPAPRTETGPQPGSGSQPGSAPQTETGPQPGSAPRPETLRPPESGHGRDPSAGLDAPARAGSPRRAGGPAGSAPWDNDPVAGIGPWTRCFAEQLQPPRQPVIPGDDKSWRVTVAANHPLRKVVDDLFPDEPGAGRTLAVIGDSDDPDARAAALSAAADAISTGQLLVISHGAGFTGFWASLHAEHPALGITLLRVPQSAAGLRAARRHAATVPGRFRELSIDTAGRPREPVMLPAEVPGGGAFPLGPTDVVLVSRGTKGAGLALAQVLACCGSPVAVIGRAGPQEDPAVVCGLEQLRSAGARIAHEVIDAANPADMAAAMQRIERRLGPVTAVGHAAMAGRPRLVAELTEDEFRAHAAAGTAGLRDLVSSIKTDRLRLIITFGSVVARYGMAGQSLLALASGSLAEQAQRLSDAIDGCRAVHVDWPGWSGAGFGERADLAAGLAQARILPIPIRHGSRQLLKMLATPGLPARVAVHGRVGVPAPLAMAGGAPPAPAAAGRFVEVTRVHYPGVELVCEARLSLRSDPYLAEHRVDGIPVLPAAMALEAMAQAASVLAGRPVRQAAGVSMIAPVVIPAGQPGSQAVIRICALRDGGTVRTAVRCADSGFAVDHFRATFGCLPDEAGAAGLFGEPGEGETAPGEGETAPGESPATHVGSAGIVDGTELYGPICFQSGRFRRVAFLPELTPRSCRALVRGGDDQPWFGPSATAGPPGAADLPGPPDLPGAPLVLPGPPLVLGSPGLNDATMHVLQACVPHRRLVAAGCDTVMFSGRETDGAVEIRAVAAGPAAAGAQAEALATGAAPSSPQPVPQPRPARPGTDSRLRPDVRPGARARALPAEYRWDVDAVDTAGNLLVSWRGLRLRDAGPLPRSGGWPAPLLSVYLERSAAELGLDGIRVSVRCGEGSSPGAGQQPQVAPGSGYLEGFALTVTGDRAACGWHAADPAQAGPAADPRLAGLRAELARRFGEPRATLNARLRAIAACLPPPDPRAPHLVIDGVSGERWVLLRTGGVVIACTVADVSGVPLPVAIAMATSGSAGADGATGPPATPWSAARGCAV